MTDQSSDRKQGWWWVLVQALLIALLLLAPTEPALHGALPWGWAVFAAGLALFVVAWSALGRAFTPNPAPKDNAQLTMHGVYRVMRHPMYTAVLLCALGWSMVWGGAIHYALSIALAVFFDAKSRAEERWLVRRYLQYAHYQASTGRFLPKLKRK
jgi:protein-S-isoprenylcysteine O-methyltransferase Ste14